MGIQGGPDIVTDDLVFYVDAANKRSYPGSGTTWIDLIGSNNGALTNTPTYSTENGGILTFNGTNEYVNMPTTPSIGNTFTITSFFKLGGSNSDTSIYCPYGQDIDNWYGIADNKLRVFFTQVSNWNNTSVSGNTTLDTTGNTWYCYTLTLNVNTVNLYLNGVLDGTSTVGFTIGGWNGSSNLNAIARRGYANQKYFLGSLGNIFIYNKVLSSTEIQHNFNVLRGRFGI